MVPPVQVQRGYDPSNSYYAQGLRARYHLDEIKTPLIKDDKVYAKIGYKPDLAQYLARSEARIRAGGLESELPAGFPKALSGPMCWSGADLTDETNVHHLTDDERMEIDAALEHFKDLELEGEDVKPSNFPLPTLGKKLEALRDDVYQGHGFAIVRGLDPDKYSNEDLIVVYLGVSSYIAERRGKQDQRGSMLVHVMDRGEQPKIRDLNTQQPFHTDTICDVLGLFTKSCSAKGGKSILASSWTVYNELAATRPDLIHVLAKADWPFDTFGRDPPYYSRAALHYHDGKMFLNFSRRLLTGHPDSPRTAGIPGLSEAQAEALDAVHFIAREHQIKTAMVKGDMRFVNNMSILHCREAFLDDDLSKRHLIRVWLNNEEMNWKLPVALRLAWARVFEDDERGVHWDIEPPRHNDGKWLKTSDSCD